MRMRFAQFTALVAALTLVGCSGAEGTATVSGEATYAGQPIESGSIQFTPKGGKGVTAGGAITAGKFSVAKVPIGDVVVSVTLGVPDTGPISSEDSAKASEADAAARKKGTYKPPLTLPAGVGGNNEPFEVKAGANTLTVKLTPPRTR